MWFLRFCRNLGVSHALPSFIEHCTVLAFTGPVGLAFTGTPGLHLPESQSGFCWYCGLGFAVHGGGWRNWGATSAQGRPEAYSQGIRSTAGEPKGALEGQETGGKKRTFYPSPAVLLLEADAPRNPGSISILGQDADASIIPLFLLLPFRCSCCLLLTWRVRRALTRLRWALQRKWWRKEWPTTQCCFSKASRAHGL